MNLRPGIVTCTLAATVAAAVGCTSTLPAPVPEWVDPPRGYGGDPQPVDIYGRAFHPLVVADASGRDGDSVDTEFRVELLDPTDASVATSARAVLVGPGSGRLQAVFPANVAIGQYDLRVTGPDGATGVLPDAYRVTSSPVEKVQVVVPAPGEWFVGQSAEVGIQLLGRGDLPELASLPLEVVVEPVGGGSIVGAVSSNLVDARPLDLGPGRLGLAGTTRADGSGTLDLRMDQAGVFNVTVRIPDADVGLDPIVRTLTWLPGDVYDVDVTVPGPAPFQTTAGSTVPVTLTLRDQSTGAVVQQPSLPVRVVLSDTCGDVDGGRIIEDLKGSRTVDVRLTTATRDAVPYGGCDSQRIQVSLATDRFFSEPLTVRPGPSERLAVEPLQSVVTAGSPQRATVRVADRFGNVTGDDLDARVLTVTDSVGDVETSGCEPIDGGAFCVVTPTDAERAVSLVVEDPRSRLQGTSRPYQVLASVPDTLRVQVDPGEGFVAGAPFPVIVRVYDEYGNDVDVTALPEGAVTVTDPLSEADCISEGPAERGQLAFTCSLFTAGETRLIAGGPGAEGDSDPFDVVNGALATLTVSPSTLRTVAGERLTLTVSAFDAWGNPYIVRTSDRVDLRSELDGLSTEHITLGEGGRATRDLALTRAGEDAIIASWGGVDLGRSGTIEVVAGPADALDVRSPAPWAFVGDTVPVDVQAVDAWGNPADLTERVTVSGRWSTFPDRTVDLVDGAGRAEVTFNDSDLTEHILARSASGLEGTLIDFIVARDCGGSGPTLFVDFDGRDDAVVCHDGATADIDGSFSGSTTLSGDLPALYALWTEHTGTQTGLTDRVTLSATETGRMPLRALIADASDCATEVVRTAWIGSDDGEAVGPLEVSLATDRLAIGSDKTTIRISDAETCDGDPADKATVLLRTDRGNVSGAASTGAGLRVLLDKTGSATATLDLIGAHTGGPGTLTAWVSSGAALGSDTFTATGDSRRPRVIEQDPSGHTLDSFESVYVRFSEPVDARSVDERSFALSAAGGSTGVTIDDVVLDDDGAGATVYLSGVLDASQDRFTFTVRDSVRDLAGNALDGTWSGTRADHEGDFGKVSAVVPDLTSCTTSTTRFRPDGDSGSGIESDRVDVSVRATRAPDVWRLIVEDAAGNQLRTERPAASGRTGTVSWDGRDATDKVVADGSYTLTIWGVNADGSEGTSCVRTVTVDNDRGF